MAEIKLVRVDYRLIHGQVVARWLKVCPVRRIVLVDDVLGSDEFMSDIYKMAVPKGTDVDIVTIDKAKEVLDNTDDTVFLISKDIETCLKLVEKGVELPAINVGAVPNEEGRKLLDPEYRNNPIVFPDDKALENCETFKFLGDENDAIYNELWRQVKSK